MVNYDFENISVTGRIAYGIMCAEEYLVYKYPDKDWVVVFKDFWEITNLELWDEWIDKTVEIIPEYLFEFNSYKSSCFEYLTESKYNKLKRVYNNTNDDVFIILIMVYELANSHVYSSINGNGRESIYHLEKIINFLKNECITLPDIKKVQMRLFSEKNGWGNPFEGTGLSKIIPSNKVFYK